MEHVGKHFEAGLFQEKEDPELRAWALRESLIKPAGRGKWLLSDRRDGDDEEDAEAEDE
jgi:hypothetical protein